jgi:hypothetical protein
MRVKEHPGRTCAHLSSLISHLSSLRLICRSGAVQPRDPVLVSLATSDDVDDQTILLRDAWRLSPTSHSLRPEHMSTLRLHARIPCTCHRRDTLLSERTAADLEHERRAHRQNAN